jgi:hypothetical protein
MEWILFNKGEVTLAVLGSWLVLHPQRGETRQPPHRTTTHTTPTMLLSPYPLKPTTRP